MSTEPTRKVKVILDKRQYKTKLVDAETGETIDGAVEMYISVDKSTDFQPIATVTLIVTDIEMAEL